jgi:hypothetical protein
LIEVRTLQPDQEQRNQKQVPMGIHRMQDNAAVVVWAMICGVVVVPENPATGIHSATARQYDRHL